MKLSNFLKEQCCYNKFVKNFDKMWAYQFAWGSNNGYLITRAFDNYRTPEDPSYWKSIHLMWNTHTENKENDMMWLMDSKGNQNQQLKSKKEEDGQVRIDNGVDSNINNTINNNGKKHAMVLNNFEEYGFTADFEGEILKEGNNGHLNQIYSGYIKTKTETIIAMWNNNGFDIFSSGYNLTPIKKEWYEDEDNFPRIVVCEKVCEGNGLYVVSRTFNGKFC